MPGIVRPLHVPSLGDNPRSTALWGHQAQVPVPVGQRNMPTVRRPGRKPAKVARQKPGPARFDIDDLDGMTFEKAGHDVPDRSPQGPILAQGAAEQVPAVGRPGIRKEALSLDRHAYGMPLEAVVAIDRSTDCCERGFGRDLRGNVEYPAFPQ